MEDTENLNLNERDCTGAEVCEGERGTASAHAAAPAVIDSEAKSESSPASMEREGSRWPSPNKCRGGRRQKALKPVIRHPGSV